MLGTPLHGCLLARKQPRILRKKSRRNAWVVTCSTSGGGTLQCQMSQNLTRSKTDPALTVTIRRRTTANSPCCSRCRTAFFCPPERLPDRQRRGKPVAIEQAMRTAPIPPIPMNLNLITALKARTNLNIGVGSVTRKPVSIPVTLAGFTAAIDQLATIKIARPPKQIGYHILTSDDGRH